MLQGRHRQNTTRTRRGNQNASRALRRARLAKAVFDKRAPRRTSGGRTIGPQDWLLYPALLCIVATFVLATDIPLPFGWDLPEPVWPMILAFSWPLIRPSYIAPFLLAGLGFFLDYFWGAPIGFYVLCLMAVYGVTLLIRSYIVGQDLWVVTVAYGLAVFLFFALGTILTVIDTGMVPRLISVFEQMLATGVLVFFVHALLERYLHADVRFN
ncbi:hypothetical protein PQU92_12035 [Asticcacaulis sp. BYS171W]|uniref:Rod shape-determining protein MreD n=1 Tax=Asticcacaulis aquaticus TaxID=2984212 RepID=A0ABT5HVM4_9CAUL|nr:hypothetical protein [Asticcacaulis aquaticus]MDC7684009.1 hypothetical protein [Asticcacaulis aquaticus]